MGKLSVRATALCAAGFAFATGFTNIICVTRYSAFGTMMTGNLLMTGKSYAETGMAIGADGIFPTPLFFLLIICARNLGLFLHYLLRTRPLTNKVGAATILAPIMVMAIFTLEYLKYSGLAPWIPERWHVWAVAFGFGVQSTVASRAMSVPTMLATGHLTNIWSTVVEVAMKDQPLTNLRTLLAPCAVCVAILLGAFAGASANKQFTGQMEHAFLLTPITVFHAILMVLVERKSTEPVVTQKKVN